MPQPLVDHRQALAGCHGGRGEGVTQIVDTGCPQPGASADALPERLQIREPAARLDAVDHPWVAAQAREAVQRVDRGFVEIISLRVGQLLLCSRAKIKLETRELDDHGK
jgi:hypothetical protein